MMIGKVPSERAFPSFIPFLMLGYPSVDASIRMADILIEEGADVLELGVPFSDPVADGPVIQEAAGRAIAGLPSLESCLEVVSRIRSRHPKTPLVLFTYYNPIFRMGHSEFSVRASQAGVTGVLVVDLPVEEAGDGYLAALNANGLKTVFLAAPTTDSDRFKKVAAASSGFLYYVSRLGVTGVRQEVSDSIESELERLREVSQIPVAVGFGISTPEQAAKIGRHADGVVVGSAFLKLIQEEPTEERGLERVRSLARGISAAIRASRV